MPQLHLHCRATRPQKSIFLPQTNLYIYLCKNVKSIIYINTQLCNDGKEASVSSHSWPSLWVPLSWFLWDLAFLFLLHGSASESMHSSSCALGTGKSYLPWHCGISRIGYCDSRTVHQTSCGYRSQNLARKHSLQRRHSSWPTLEFLQTCSLHATED